MNSTKSGNRKKETNKDALNIRYGKYFNYIRLQKKDECKKNNTSGWTLKDVAAKWGIKDNHVCLLEKGETIWHARHIERAALILDMTPEEFVGNARKFRPKKSTVKKKAA